MKKILFTLSGILTLLLAILLLSFTAPDGGEGFEVYIGNRIVAQQFGTKAGAVALNRDLLQAGQSLVVKYYHCGQPGKQRVLTLRSEKNKLLKEWKYGDAKQAGAGMLCPVNELLALLKNQQDAMGLYYSSTETGKEKKLLTIEHPVIARK